MTALEVHDDRCAVVEGTAASVTAPVTALAALVPHAEDRRSHL
jgi:hypothetical protein